MRLRHQITNLAGSLLVALPTLTDLHFRRTILLLSHHDPDEGSVGFVLNRPKELCLGDLTSPQGMGIGNDQIPVYEGGPVEHKSLIVARLHWSEERASLQSLDREEIPLVTQTTGIHGDTEDLRAFTGYAGWSGGQLERELDENSWVLLPPTIDLLLPVKTPEEGNARWRAIMKSLGPLYHLMAQTPDELGLN
jgi:putative transcriptional regulator